MVSSPWTNFVHTKQVKQWPELGHLAVNVLFLRKQACDVTEQ